MCITMDLKNMCRACLRKPKKSTDLFIDSALLHRIDVIASVKLENIEGMPDQICEDCLKNVNHLFNFRKLLISTDIDLRSRFETLQKTGNKCKPNVKELIQNAKLESEIKTNSAENAAYLDIVTTKNTEIAETKRCCPQKYFMKCDKCDKVFDDRSKYKKHQTYHKNVLMSGVCNICGAQVLIVNLRTHMKIHTEKPYGCEVCGKVLKNSNSMRSHMLRHSDKVIICEICGKEFNVEQNLRRHMKSHLDLSHRRKPCHVCGRQINCFGMKKHMRKHTGERPHVCPYCDKGLTTSYALKVHIRLHTNEKPFVCDHCPCSFPQKASLQNHLRSAHGIPHHRNKTN